MEKAEKVRISESESERFYAVPWKTWIAIPKLILKKSKQYITKDDKVSMVHDEMEAAVSHKIYRSLRHTYLFVYLLASFADWLQGPYLYRLYSTYGYRKDEISSLYVIGFASATVSGILIGHFADKFGRKRLCMIYSLTTTATCLIISITDNYSYLAVGRAFGGASTCILFSTFESWYTGQHLTYYRLDSELIADVFAKATFYNGFLAIIAGISASILADTLEFGPLAPFLLAVPVSLLAGYSCSVLWHENQLAHREEPNTGFSFAKSLDPLLYATKKDRMLLLGASQSLFEAVMYIFVFLWTPVLEPLEISNGLIFGTFMLCIMFGSAVNYILATKYRVKRENLFCLSIIVATVSIVGSTLGVYLQNISSNDDIRGCHVSLVSFLLFEISVGIYYPAVGYLRGIVVPESHRASIANWFRLPSNVIICFALFYITVKIPDNTVIFAASSFALVVASIASIKFARIFSRDCKNLTNVKLLRNFVQ